MIYKLPLMFLDSAKRKVIRENVYGLPYSVHVYHTEEFSKNHKSVHWHKEFEINVPLEGERVISYVDNHELIMDMGCATFINSNVIHGAEQHPVADRKIMSIFFDPSFIGGYEKNNAFWGEYLWPIIRNPELRSMIFHPEITWQKECIEGFQNILKLEEAEPPFHEFQVRQILTDFLCRLYQHSDLDHTHMNSSNDASLLTTMLSYINNNYREDISVDDIAKSANVSLRQCYREFKNQLQVSPNIYLNSFRVQQACKLLTDSDISITEICFATGFTSCSYFSTKFKQVMGCSPLEFRKNLVSFVSLENEG